MKRSVEWLGRSARRLLERCEVPWREPSSVSPSAAYDLLAEWYDWSGALEFAESSIEVVRGVALEHRLCPRHHLDLACGTGTLLVEQAKQGIACTGLDRSLPMLEIARAKAEAAGVPVALACSDLRRPALRARFDLVTCFYDVLNHLTDPSDLTVALASAAEHLEHDGLLIFDTSNEHMYERLWTDGMQEIPMSGATVRVSYRYDASTRVGVARLLLDRPLLEPLEEWVTERCHTREEVARAVSAAGLRVLSREDHPHFAGESASLKDLWVCRRP